MAKILRREEDWSTGEGSKLGRLEQRQCAAEPIRKGIRDPCKDFESVQRESRLGDSEPQRVYKGHLGCCIQNKT